MVNVIAMQSDPANVNTGPATRQDETDNLLTPFVFRLRLLTTKFAGEAFVFCLRLSNNSLFGRGLRLLYLVGKRGYLVVWRSGKWGGARS